MNALTQVIDGIGAALPPGSEILLHDLGKLPESIVAVSGSVTGRAIGDPATDYLLEMAGRGSYRTYSEHESQLASGQQLRSATAIIYDPHGEPMAAVCINTDTTAWHAIAGFARAMTGTMPGESGGTSLSTVVTPAEAALHEPEHFVRDVDELADLLLERALAGAGRPVASMRKRHKLEVVRYLRERGFFLLKDSVDVAAKSLGITRFTIYNYFNELDQESPEAS